MKRKCRTLVVMGNGPSLKSIDFDQLDNVDTFGLNSAYRAYRRLNWWPTYHGCFDYRVTNSHEAEFRALTLQDNPIKRFFYLKSLSKTERLSLITFSGSFKKNSEWQDQEKYFDSFHDGGNSGANACRVGVCLGYTKIILVGVDCNYVEIVEGAVEDGGALTMKETPRHNPNYWFDDYQQVGDEYNRPQTNIFQLPGWEALSRQASAHGIEIVNCSPGTKLTCFPVVPLKEAVKPKSLNVFFDQIYCINLQSDTSRLKRFSRIASDLNFTFKRIEAVGPDSRVLQKKYAALVDGGECRHPGDITGVDAGRVKGALGCSLSHIKAIKDARKNKYEKILLLEDDVLPNKLYSRLINFLYFPEEWKFLYLGGNTHGRLANIDYLHYNFFNKSRGIAGTYAWGLHSSMFSECIKAISDLKDGCDRRLATLHRKYPSDTYICKDHLFIPDTSDSSIRNVKADGVARKWLGDMGFSWDMIHPNYIPPALVPLSKELGINGRLSDSEFLEAKEEALARAKRGGLKPLRPALPHYIYGDGEFSTGNSLDRLSLFLDEFFCPRADKTHPNWGYLPRFPKRAPLLLAANITVMGD